MAEARAWNARGRKARLLVVDDHPIIHHGMRLLLEDSDRVEIAGHAESGHEAITARRVAPDVMLMGERLPDMVGAEVVRGVRLASPATRIVVFAEHVTPTALEEAGRLQVHGLLGKDAVPQRVVDVIARVAAGEVVAERVPDQALRRAARKLHCPPLTPREHEVLVRAASGESNAEIGHAIYLAPTTVKSYLQSALPKLGARNRVQAVVKLSELGLL